MISLFTGGVIHFFDKILLNHLFFDFSRLFLGSLVGAVLFLLLGRLFKIISLQDLINIIKRK
jgi:hypothetical protein